MERAYTGDATYTGDVQATYTGDVRAHTWFSPMPATTSVKRAMEQSLQKAVKAAAKRPAREWDHKSLLVAGACLVAGLLMALLEHC